MGEGWERVHAMLIGLISLVYPNQPSVASRQCRKLGSGQASCVLCGGPSIAHYRSRSCGAACKAASCGRAGAWYGLGGCVML